MTLKINFPTDKYNALRGLSTQCFMTPSWLSRLTMLTLLLPAQLPFVVTKNKPLLNDETEFCNIESLLDRLSNPQARNHSLSLMRNLIHLRERNLLAALPRTHTLKSLSINGLETLEVKVKETQPHQHYEILCAGNGMDGIKIFMNTCESIISAPNKNYIFWNYPGVGSSKRATHSVNDLFKAAYQQVKRLLDEGVPAKYITLKGHSLGGGLATHVARQLHEEGYFINLTVDRSFSRLAAVIPATIQSNDFNTPLITSALAFSLAGITLGTTVAGLVGTIGLVTASIIAGIGYVGALCIQLPGILIQKIILMGGKIIGFLFNFVSKPWAEQINRVFNALADCLAYPFYITALILNNVLSTLASFMEQAINLIGSVVGGCIAVSGLIAGGSAGFLIGLMISAQWLWTNTPQTIPTTPFFSGVLHSLCCEMDSVHQMSQLLKQNPQEPPIIKVIHTQEDEIIPLAASLYTGLQPLKGKGRIGFFCYPQGSHMEDLSAIERRGQQY